MYFTADLVTIGLTLLVHRFIAKPVYTWIKAMWKYAWSHKKVVLTLVGCFVFGEIFHNQNNTTATIHEGDGITGTAGYVLVGFANFFHGVLMGLGNLAYNLSCVPTWVGEKAGDVPFCFEAIGLYILLYGGYGALAFAKALAFWGTTYVLKAETLWNVVILGLLIFLASGGLGSLVGAAMAKGKSSGGHAPKASGHHP